MNAVPVDVCNSAVVVQFVWTFVQISQIAWSFK